MAQGSEPSPPASETATASSASDEPAIGAWMIGSSIPANAVKRLSNPMKDRLNHKDTKAQRGRAATNRDEPQAKVFPSWDRRGRRAIKKMPRSLLWKAR